jgi:hypothetical protein
MKKVDLPILGNLQDTSGMPLQIPLQNFGNVQFFLGIRIRLLRCQILEPDSKPEESRFDLAIPGPFPFHD